MRLLLYIVAVVLVLSGGVFALQGLSLLPSRVMYGRQEWVVIGAVMVVVGVLLFGFATRRARRAAQAADKLTR